MQIRTPDPALRLPSIGELVRDADLYQRRSPLIGWRKPPPIVPAVNVAAPTFQAAGTEQSADGGGSDVTPAWPTHAVDDIALLLVTQYNASSTDPGAATLTTANGFVQVTGASKLSTFSTVRVRGTVFWCRATSASMSAPVVKGIAGCSLIAQIVTFRGCIASGDPWDVVSTSSNDNSDTSYIATGATTTGADRLVVAGVFGGAAATMSAWANSDLSSVTERSDVNLNSGFGTSPKTCHVGCATGEKAAAGAYGNTTATLSSTDVWVGITIALKPPATATGTGNMLLLGVG